MSRKPHFISMLADMIKVLYRKCLGSQKLGPAVKKVIKLKDPIAVGQVSMSHRFISISLAFGLSLLALTALPSVINAAHNNPSELASPLITRHDSYGVVLAPDSITKSDYRGALVDYALLLTNSGDVSDSFTVTVRSAIFTTTVAPTIIGPLDANMSETVTVTVQIPVSVTLGTSDTAIIAATSRSAPAQSVTSILTTIVTTTDPIFDFPSTVIDMDGHVYELWEIQALSRATLHWNELNSHVIALQVGEVTRLIWLPLIRQLRRLPSSAVEVTLVGGDKIVGEWVRNRPRMYPHESTNEFIVGVQINDQGRETILLPWNTIASIEPRPTSAQMVRFQKRVHDYLDGFQDTSRPVTVTLQTYPPLEGVFGFIVDGGGTWSSYNWYTPHDPNLKFWQRGTSACTSGYSSYPPADEIPLNQVSALVFTGVHGECDNEVLDVSLSSGTAVTGSLISRYESYGGTWGHGYGVNVDSLILFSPYGADSIPLADVARIDFSTDRVCLWYDSCWWLLGVNYPWLHYGHDFGQAVWPGGSWPHDGMSNATSRQQVETDLAYLKSKGVHVLRTFVFGDGRAAPEFDAQGNVTGFDNYFYLDFDTALSLTCQYDLHLIPVLLDYSWLDSPQWSGGVQLGGHSEVITDTAKRQSFFDKALVPLLERYGNNPCIIAWDVINEPEWAMRGVPGGGTINSTVTITEMQSFVQEVADYIHLYTAQDVTLGSAQGQWLPYWWSMNLDFYQFHYYDPMGQQSPFVPYSSLGLDKPAILGEFPTKSTALTVTRYLSTTWENGYAGALAWSLNGNDSASDFEGHAEEFQLWSQLHDSAVNIPSATPTATPTSTPTPTPTSTPTKTQTPTPTATGTPKRDLYLPLIRKDPPPTSTPTPTQTPTPTLTPTATSNPNDCGRFPVSPNNRYRANTVSNGTSIHYQVVEIQTSNVVLTTYAQYSTPNDVKAGGFSADSTKFAAAYQYSHAGNYTWIGVWSTETGAFLYARTKSGWTTNLCGVF